MANRQIPSAENLLTLACGSLQLVEAIRSYLPVDPEIIPQEPIIGIDRFMTLGQVATIAQGAANGDYRADEETGSRLGKHVMSGWSVIEVNSAWSHTSKALETVLDHYGWTSMRGKSGYMFVEEGAIGTRDGKNQVPVEEVMSPDIAVIRQSNPPAIKPIPAGKLNALEHFASILTRTVNAVLQSQEQAAASTAVMAAPAAAKPEDDPPCRHSEDFRCVVWYGTTYGFSATQAPAVRMLWEAWENGTPDLSQLTIIDSIGSESQRLSDLFSKSKAWKTMIVPGETKGAFRLSDPPQ